MRGFNDTAAVERAAKAMNLLAHRQISDFILSAAEDSSRPDQAVVSFERLLSAASSAPTVADTVLSVPELGRLLVALLGASHQVAEVLVQNPELVYSILSPETLGARPTQDALRKEVTSLLSASVSFSHSLDRLRYFKQSWHVRIAAADLAGVWQEPEVWRTLSDVADTIVAEACKVVWREVTSQRDVTSPCPVSVIAFGKLGGQELNFSSDIDLVFVLDDGASDELEKLALKHGEALNRGLADRMGRGALYRVDHRLRPYGSRGPLVTRMKAIEGYYDRYAESWEHLALVRSRPIVDAGGINERWSVMRDKTCFIGARSEMFVDEILHTRDRIESLYDENDIKRGRGGIRDVEFLVQVLQLLYGKQYPEVRCGSTLEAIDHLSEEGIVPQDAAQDLRAAYTSLRQIEHRIQLLGDQQAHSVPESVKDRTELALRSGYSTLEAFDTALSMHRGHVRSWYEEFLTPRAEESDIGGEHARSILHWIEDLPESKSFLQSALENESSLDRMVRIIEVAPALVPSLRQLPAVTEQVMSGEVMEPLSVGAVHSLARDDTEGLARWIRRSWLKCCVRWALDEWTDLGEELSVVYDAALEHLLSGLRLEPVALGSYGARELLPYSDLDVLFWLRDGTLSDDDEKRAQSVLGRVQELRRFGAPIELDLRLRPDGRKGRLVQSAESFSAYAKSAIEPWERLALGRARICGVVPAPLIEAAFGTEINPGILASLRHMKSRVERERVPVQHWRRHIKLGQGGQDDVLWSVGTLWWKHFGGLGGNNPGTAFRIAELASHGKINIVESEGLMRAWTFYRKVRTHLALLGFNDDVMPENPDRLGKLASVTGKESGNAVLAEYEGHRAMVRGFLEATFERLGG